MEVSVRDLPPARIACLRHTGPYGAPVSAFWRSTSWPWLMFEGDAATLNVACAKLLREWLPASGLQLGGRPLYEQYPNDLADRYPGPIRCRICVPVRPLGRCKVAT